jgi:hypothetical protein
VNFLDDDEDPNDYENFSSGESNGDGVEDEDGDGGAAEEDDDHITNDDAEEMDAAFLSAARGNTGSVADPAAAFWQQYQAGR